jgi:hypothetical protein
MPYPIQSTTVKQEAGGFVVEMTIEPPAAVVIENPDFVAFRMTLKLADQYPRLAELQKAALEQARAGLDAEIKRLQLAQGRNF